MNKIKIAFLSLLALGTALIPFIGNGKMYFGRGLEAKPYILVSKTSSESATTTRFFGNLEPQTTNHDDIGSPAYSWRNIYVSGTFVGAASTFTNATFTHIAVTPGSESLSGFLFASTTAGTSNGLYKAPTAGAGERFMWVPKNFALRAGGLSTSTGSRWNDGQLGDYSVGLGLDAWATATGSVSLGYRNVASGLYSFSAGQSSTATGQAGQAIGFSNSASGNFSTALGSNSEATGTSGVAIGRFMEAGGDFSVALGYFSNAYAQQAMAFGSHMSVMGYGSMGIGLGGGVYSVSASSVMAVLGGKMGVATSTPNADLEIYGNTSSTGLTWYSASGTNVTTTNMEWTNALGSKTTSTFMALIEPLAFPWTFDDTPTSTTNKPCGENKIASGATYSTITTNRLGQNSIVLVTNLSDPGVNTSFWVSTSSGAIRYNSRSQIVNEVKFNWCIFNGQ